MTGAGDGSHALLVLGFESPQHDVEPSMRRAVECCREHGGKWERRDGARKDDAGGTGDGRARQRSRQRLA